jgi:hypothetical protein
VPRLITYSRDASGVRARSVGALATAMKTGSVDPSA